MNKGITGFKSVKKRYIFGSFILIALFISYKYLSWDSLYKKANNYVSKKVTEQNIYMSTYPEIALDDLWETYKQRYIQKDGRTIDHSAQEITTSEGQSYSLLRSVWSDDKTTFDIVWKWTNVNLKKRDTDNLFAWKWGQNPDGSWGVINDGGINTASDADQDIALSLILAYERWNDTYYLDQAKKILNDIWDVEVVQVGGKPYLTAGNWAQNGNILTVNPSYYDFAAYPLFQEIDPSHDWLALKDTSYEVLNKLTTILPPDWGQIDTDTGSVTPIGLNGNQVMFSQDALRIPWRVTLDLQWNGDTRAKDYLDNMNFFINEWQKNGVIKEAYDLHGTPIKTSETLSMYSSLLPVFKNIDHQVARQILQSKIEPKFNQDTGDFRNDVGYYNANWSWFGLALYQDKNIIINSFQKVSYAGD